MEPMSLVLDPGLVAGGVVSAMILALKIVEWKKINPRRDEFHACKWDGQKIEKILERFAMIENRTAESQTRLMDGFGHLIETVRDHESEETRILATMETQQRANGEAMVSALREIVAELRLMRRDYGGSGGVR
jgi:biopolymer transport protein ExbB/TolQ